MEANIGNVKYIIINKSENANKDNLLKVKNEQTTTQVYLGIIISADRTMELETTNRVKKATKIHYSLNDRIFGKKEQVKLRILDEHKQI